MNVGSTSNRVLKSALKLGATTFKLLGITTLVLLLLIPLHMIRSTLGERLQRRNEAVSDITATWGREQTIVGPVLVVPYRTGDGGGVGVRHAYFLPAELSVLGSFDTRQLERGIYKTAVYSGDVKLTGRFARPDWRALRIDEKEVLWDRAMVTIAITDLRATRGALRLKWGESDFPLVPGCKLAGFSPGVHARLGGWAAEAETVAFEVALPLNGSGAIDFTPVGTQTTVRLDSRWPDPSFRGAFLPAKRSVSSTGFDAEWQVSYYGREFEPQWTDQTSAGALTAETARASQFGVAFLNVVDHYRNVERAIKYGVLFLALVFAAFFLFEVITALRIHPFQYTLVGAALCLFYLALLSLSEFIPFHFAYLAAALAATVMISLYCVAVLQSGQRTSIISTGLVGIYGFLYVTLQLQDYSLLAGTAGLFLVLAGLMYVTRRIDWYARDQAPPASPPPLPATK